MNFCHKKELQSQDQLQSKNIASSLPHGSQRLRFLFYTTKKKIMGKETYHNLASFAP